MSFEHQSEPLKNGCGEAELLERSERENKVPCIKGNSSPFFYLNRFDCTKVDLKLPIIGNQMSLSSRGQKFKNIFLSTTILGVTRSNPRAMPTYSLVSCLGELFMKIPNFDIVFLISALICYDVTMKSTEALGHYSGSTDKECSPKLRQNYNMKTSP